MKPSHWRHVEYRNGFGQSFWKIEMKYWWWPFWVDYSDSRFNYFGTLSEVKDAIDRLKFEHDPRHKFISYKATEV